jgi:hypothetical protein
MADAMTRMSLGSEAYNFDIDVLLVFGALVRFALRSKQKSILF